MTLPPSKVDPELRSLLERALEAERCMTSEQRREMWRRQRESFARGEAGMGSDADEAKYAAALRAGDVDAIAECERKSAKRVALAQCFIDERGV